MEIIHRRENAAAASRWQDVQLKFCRDGSKRRTDHPRLGVGALLDRQAFPLANSQVSLKLNLDDEAQARPYRD